MFDPGQHLKSTLEHPYQTDVCFICARPLSTDNRTEEHVIPKWLQRKYDLWNEELILINQTGIRYKQLKIPCCYECNNIRLSPLEERINNACDLGFESVRSLPTFDLFRWMAKIYLGILYKELSLLVDRKSPHEGTILTPEFIRQYAILHFWLQMKSCANDPRYSPGSLWVFRCQVPGEIDLRFDLKDDIANGVIALRIGRIALIADFLDNGVHQQINAEMVSRIQQIELHPMQFRELVATIVYESRLLCQKSEIEFFQRGDSIGYAIEWWSTVDGDKCMNPWVKAEYAKYLSFYTGVPYESAFHPPELLTTWLRDPQGNFVYWPLGEPHPFAGCRP